MSLDAVGSLEFMLASVAIVVRGRPKLFAKLSG